MVLDVPDSAAPGTFAYLAPELGGGMLISDAGRGRLIRYDETGTLTQVIGTYGSGPGEFRATSVARVVDSGRVLAVVDPQQRRITLLDPRSGGVLGGIAVPFVEPGQTWTERGADIVFGVQAAPFLLGRLRLDDSAFTPVGKTPERLLANLLLYLSYGRVEVIPYEGGYLAMVPVLQGVQVLDSLGSPLGMIDPPAHKRRGKPQDLLDRQERMGPTSSLLGSIDGAMTQLSDGSIAILNMDVDVADAQPPQPTAIRYFVTLLSGDLSAACVDLEVQHDPAATGPWPVFAGSSLFLTADHIEGDSVRTVVYRHAIDPSRCEWVPLGGMKPSPLSD